MIIFPGDNKPRVLKSDTRQWTSGRVKFALIGWEGKPEKNWIIFEKNFFGKAQFPDQKFNLHFRDWVNLKRLIDGELTSISGWEKTVSVIDKKSLEDLIDKDPDIFEKVLSNPNILKLSESSFESLDRIAVKIYEIKADKIDLILKEISETTSSDLEKFSILLNDLRLNQVSMMTSLIYQKLRTIDLLEKVIMSGKNKEIDVHQVFENNSWLLGKNFEIVSSDRPLWEYLGKNLKDDPETNKRPDIIAKIIPYSQEVVIVELKRPGIKLRAQHIGQVLEYKALVMKHKPNTEKIHCFVFGYEKSDTFLQSNDAVIKTFSEIVSQLRNEYKEYQRILDIGRETNI